MLVNCKDYKQLIKYHNMKELKWQIFLPLSQWLCGIEAICFKSILFLANLVQTFLRNLKTNQYSVLISTLNYWKSTEGSHPFLECLPHWYSKTSLQLKSCHGPLFWSSMSKKSKRDQPCHSHVEMKTEPKLLIRVEAKH